MVNIVCDEYLKSNSYSHYYTVSIANQEKMMVDSDTTYRRQSSSTVHSKNKRKIKERKEEQDTGRKRL